MAVVLAASKRNDMPEMHTLTRTAVNLLHSLSLRVLSTHHGILLSLPSKQAGLTWILPLLPMSAVAYLGI